MVSLMHLLSTFILKFTISLLMVYRKNILENNTMSVNTLFEYKLLSDDEKVIYYDETSNA